MRNIRVLVLAGPVRVPASRDPKRQISPKGCSRCCCFFRRFATGRLRAAGGAEMHPLLAYIALLNFAVLCELRLKLSAWSCPRQGSSCRLRGRLETPPKRWLQICVLGAVHTGKTSACTHPLHATPNSLEISNLQQIPGNSTLEDKILLEVPLRVSGRS